MTVKTATEQVQGARHTLIELLMSDHPAPCARQLHSGDCELEHLAAAAGITEPRFPRRTTPRGKDDSSAVIAVDHESCILCDRCIRGCDDIRHNWVLARRGKGYQAGIAFDNNLPDGWVVVRFLRRVHGVVPHRCAHQQAGCRNGVGRRRRSRSRRAFAPADF